MGVGEVIADDVVWIAFPQSVDSSHNGGELAMAADTDLDRS